MLNAVEKLAQFNRERVPERVVHAKGTGAYGYFETTEDVSQYTRAAPPSTSACSIIEGAEEDLTDPP